MSANNSANWSQFYKAGEGRALRPLYTEWASLNGAFTGQAVDLGCGDGMETLALLQMGWRVLAIDREAEAIARLTAKAPPDAAEKLEARQLAFEQINILPYADLIHAAYSIPFCAPEYFPTLWRLIVGALNQDGRFVGQLFGVRDEWAGSRTMTFHSAEQVAALFEPFVFESYQEFEGERPTALGDMKQWHVFHIIARRRGFNG
jgi:SAM-dependent methyltransferase